MKFEIGYEIGSGERVDADLHHLFISGVTQHSGKTTSLEAFVSRIGLKTLVFRCGRGEIGFDQATQIPPFFRERTDWQFVEGVLSAHLKEKMKFYRGDIMKACRGAKKLEDVAHNVATKLAEFERKKPDSFVAKIYTELDQYFREVIPEIRKIDFARSLELVDGMNLIDLEGVPVAVQQLIISSCVDRIMESMEGVIIVIPEAWQMIPEEGRSPVKMTVENMIRQGAKIRNYVWLDSQQLTRVDMSILRNVDIWLFGRQSLDLEKERVAKAIPGRRVTADQMHYLTIGQFWLVQYGEKVRQVYVRPAWLPAEIAQQIAMKRLNVKAAEAYKPEPRKRNKENDDMVWKERYDEARKEAERMKTEIDALERKFEAREKEVERAIERNLSGSDTKKLERELSDLREQLRKKDIIIRELKEIPADEIPVRAPSNHDYERMANEVLKVLEERSHPVWLRLQEFRPDLEVEIVRPKIEASETTIQGKIGVLISEGFFDNDRTYADVAKEAEVHGWGFWKAGTNYQTMKAELEQYAEWAFLRKEIGADKKAVRWHLNPDVKKRIKIVKE